MMKSIASILTLVIVVMIVVPCIDKPHDDTWVKTELAQKTNDDGSQHHIPGHCTPFCSCNCCQVIFTTSVSPSISVPEDYITEYTGYFVNFIGLKIFDLFIPPRI